MLTEITNEQFHAKLKAETRNIHPRIVSRWDEKTGYTSEWIDQNTQAIWGKSQSGDCHGSGNGKRYWIESR